jgi:Tfp pilus assembly protein PilF
VAEGRGDAGAAGELFTRAIAADPSCVHSLLALARLKAAAGAPSDAEVRLAARGRRAGGV